MRKWSGCLVLVWLLASASTSAAAGWEFGEKGKRYMKLSTRFQFRYTAFDDSNVDENSFRIRRMRFKMEGDAEPWLKYELQLDGDTTASGSTPDRIRIRDINLGMRVDKAGKVWFKAGQFKAPFSGEELTSSSSLFGIDRAQLNRFVPARQIGAQIGSSTKTDDLYMGSENKYDWAVGVFNGNGVNQTRNDNNSTLVAARFSLHPNEYYTVGANVVTSEDSASTGNSVFGVNFDGRRNLYGFDGGLYYGAFSVYGEYLKGSYDPKDASAPDRDVHGAFIQPGYYVVPGKWQVWYRYDAIDPDENFDDVNDSTWHWIGVNYFISGHDYKVQAAYVSKREDFNSIDNDTFLIQTQIQF
jgi:phosphate-selective porin